MECFTLRNGVMHAEDVPLPAIAEAVGTTDEATTSAAYDRAEDIVQSDAPVIPVTYGTGWALAREGLLGAGQNGLGALRFAGLAWDQP